MWTELQAERNFQLFQQALGQEIADQDAGPAIVRRVAYDTADMSGRHWNRNKGLHDRVFIFSPAA